MKLNKFMFFIFMLHLLLITILPSSVSSVVENQNNDEFTLVIGVVDGQNAYNITEMILNPNTEYIFVFENTDALTNHNLRIDVDNDLKSEGDVGDSDDILVGDENDNGGGVGSYEGTWTTPVSGNFTYYCGFSGHYAAGMEGYFLINSSAMLSSSPSDNITTVTETLAPRLNFSIFFVTVAILSLSLIVNGYNRRSEF